MNTAHSRLHMTLKQRNGKLIIQVSIALFSSIEDAIKHISNSSIAAASQSSPDTLTSCLSHSALRAMPQHASEGSLSGFRVSLLPAMPLLPATGAGNTTVINCVQAQRFKTYDHAANWLPTTLHSYAAHSSCCRCSNDQCLRLTVTVVDACTYDCQMSVNKRTHASLELLVTNAMLHYWCWHMAQY
eukprot:13206-Heterococcus_DN1.PRE.13